MPRPMRATPLRALRLALVLAAVAPAATAVADPPAYYPSGPQTNVQKSDLTGWQQCWTGAFTSTTPLSGARSAVSCRGIAASCTTDSRIPAFALRKNGPRRRGVRR